jgi:hypothetical protein
MLYSINGPDVNTESYQDERESIIKELRGYNLMFGVAEFNELVDSIVPINLNYEMQIQRYSEYITDFDGRSFSSISLTEFRVSIPLIINSKLDDQ